MEKQLIDLGWIRPSVRDIEIELTQCREEGKDTSSLDDLVAVLKGLDFDNNENAGRFGEFLDATANLPISDDYLHIEPSDLEGIHAQRTGSSSDQHCELDEDALFDRVHGAWLGRIAGCMLGKPVEGRSSSSIRRCLEAQDNWPLRRYFSVNNDSEMHEECPIAEKISFEGMTYAVEDDDINYTTTALVVCKTYGRNFTPCDVASIWLQDIPVMHTFTAERVAYRNFLNLITPPDSASYRNPCREWIGAQIRADFYGYVCPGDPARAAEFAWRDACISHVKNGIYGAMWVAAMLAAAYTTDDIEAVIRAGLAEIPRKSRLHESITKVLDQYNEGRTYEDAIVSLRSRWNESVQHDWCHTISNAMIVAIALLWGERDLTRTLGYAVMPGFDTDCNGATAGSVLGMILGAKRLPAEWTNPLNDTLETGVSGYHRVKISDMARETLALINV